MTREGESPLPADRPEPVITYSLVSDDDRPRDGERTEPRLVKPSRAHTPRFDEVAAPVPDDDLVEDIAPEKPASRRAPRARDFDERPRSSFARIVVVVGILALVAGGAVLAVTYTGAIKPTVTVIRAPAGGDTTAPAAIDTPDATARLSSSPAEQTTTVIRNAAPATAATEEPATPPLPRARPTMDASAPATKQAQPAPETTASTPPPAAPAVAPERTATAPAEPPLPKRAPVAEGDVNSLMSSVDQILAAERAKTGGVAADTAGAPAMDSDTPMDMPAPSLETTAVPPLDPSAPLAVEDLPLAPDAPPGQMVFDANGDPIPPADIPNVDPHYSGW